MTGGGGESDYASRVTAVRILFWRHDPHRARPTGPWLQRRPLRLDSVSPYQTLTVCTSEKCLRRPTPLTRGQSSLGGMPPDQLIGLRSRTSLNITTSKQTEPFSESCKTSTVMFRMSALVLAFQVIVSERQTITLKRGELWINPSQHFLRDSANGCRQFR